MTMPIGATAIARAVQSGDLTARSVIDSTLARSEKHNSRLGAFTDVTRDRALARATAIDADSKHRPLLPLAGRRRPAGRLAGIRD